MPEIIDEKVLWKGRFLKSILITFKNSVGELIHWEAMKRLNCKGIVAIVPFTKDGEIILIKQFRPPVKKFVIEFPAGLNDNNESLKEVAKRELLEETGYKAETVKEIARGPLSAGASTEILTVYVANDVVYAGKQKLDTAEEIEVIKISKDGFYKHLYSLEDDNTYVDLKTCGLYEMAIRER